ncbi:sensor domain-containing diguanylate cyclase [Anaerolentibacter hominis]|uniref:sensor domain-containing diguanylate cyclase n=1 Tax=Anaerolentibacter hominis TaxID=3079009 RepID=UPI0031B898DF
MKKNILLRTNLLVCAIIIAGFLITAVLSYRANYSESLKNIEQVSNLTSEGIYYQINSIFTKPVNVSLTMANDSLLKSLLQEEGDDRENQSYEETIREYLDTYRIKYEYDSVFLVSAATNLYYNFNGADRVLLKEDPENIWYYDMLESGTEYAINVDNDEVEGADNEITVFVNCKIRDANQKIVGIVGVGVRIDHLQKLLRAYQDEFGVNAYLIDGEGLIEISAEYSGYEHVSFFEKTLYDDQTRQEVLGWKEEETSHGFWAEIPAEKGRMNYLVTRYLPELEWSLAVEQNTGLLTAKLARQMEVTVAVICVILLAVLYIITRVIRKFNRQIVTLERDKEQERHNIFEKATEQLFDKIYEMDITNNRPSNRATEEYFESLGAPRGVSFDKALHIIAQKQIKEEFRRGYIETFTPESVIRAFHEGTDTLRYEFMISNDGEHYFWMRITARLIWQESNQTLHMLTYRQNIDAEKRREEQMVKLAQTDEMTGMLTKSGTQHRMDRELAADTGKLFAFLILDIDNFKQANDLFGHVFGDGVIHDFTQIIRAHFNATDILGRVGGDEFAVFCAVPDEAWAEEKVKTLSAALDHDYEEDGHCWHVSASIGVAFARPGDSRELLYKYADAALYETKRKGKNGYTVCRQNQKKPQITP